MPALITCLVEFFNGRKCLSVGTPFKWFGKYYFRDLIPHLLQLDLLEEAQRA